MGWQDLHLHRFEAGGWGDEVSEASTLAQIAGPGDRLGYVYDFGDFWCHLLEVDKVLTRPRPGTVYPRCTAGRGACPPEDTGGPPGYAWLLAGLRHRTGARYRETCEHLGRRFDPAAFDRGEVNTTLAALAAHNATTTAPE